MRNYRKNELKQTSKKITESYYLQDDLNQNEQMELKKYLLNNLNFEVLTQKHFLSQD